VSSTRPELSLIVVNYHSGEPLRRLLKSLAEGPPRASFELIVVDNSPSDGVARWLEDEHPELRVVSMPRNVGYAGAVNAGLRRSRAETLLVVNPDVVLEGRGVDTALDYLRAHSEVGIVGAHLRNADGSSQNNARRFYTVLTILLRRTPLGRLWPSHPELRRHLMLDDDLSQPGPVDWVTGAWMMVRRDALESVGPMDERYFLYFEDVDWCYRMWEGGWEVHLVPAASFEHGYQRTSTRVGRSLVHHLRSFVSFYDKWGAFVYVAKHLRAPLRTFSALMGDVLALNAAFLAAFFVRRWMDPLFPQPLFDLVDYLPLLVFTNAVSLITLPLLGRYRHGENERSMSRWIGAVRAALLVVLIVMAGNYLSYTRTFSRAVLLLFVPFYLVFLETFRRLRQRILAGAESAESSRQRALLLGSPAWIHEQKSRLRAAEDLPWLAGAIPVPAAPVEGMVLGTEGELDTIVDRYRIAEILVQGQRSRSTLVAATLRELAASGVEVLLDAPGIELAGSDRAVAQRHGQGWWRVRAPAASTDSGAFKWLLDRPIGLVLCLSSLPGFVLCSAIGRPLGLVGVRTLRRQGLRHREIRWKELYASRSGRALPGIVQFPLYRQVLGGALSLAGPYPLPVGTEEELDPIRRLRFTVRPGLAGLWQQCPNSAGLDQITASDLDYLERWTLTLDLDLFLSAVPQLLASRGRWHRLGSTTQG
jgi:GT2 family glycosyltransferase